MIHVPVGVVGLDFLREMNNATYGNRSQRFSYYLQSNEGAPMGALSGVTGGQLEWHATAQVKSGGKIVVQQASRADREWTKVRVRIVMTIDGLGDFPLGVFVPSAPSEDWDDTGLTLSIELLDKCSILAEDYVATTKSYPAGTVVTDAVRALIVSSGEKAGSITDSADTLDKSMTWEAGTSKLTIINDLLQAADFFSLIADGNGHFRAEKQRPAKSRPVRYDFVDNYQSIFLPQFKYDKDIYSIPNKVIVIGKGSGEQEAWTAESKNENPNSPYSYQSRGRWITDVQKGVEATSEVNLQNHANRRLAQLSSPQGVVSITHAPLPWLRVNDAVRFRRSPSGIDMKAVIQSMQIPLDPTGLMKTQLLEVVDLG